MPIDYDTLHNLYVTEGLTQRQIAERLKVSNWTVRRAIFEAGLGDQSRPSKRPDADTLRSLHVTQELTVEQIAGRYDVTCETVRRWLTANNIAVRRRTFTAPDRLELRDLYLDQELPLNRIAAIYGVSRSTVTGWMREANIPIRAARPNVPDAPPDDELRALYIEDRHTLQQLGAKFGVSTPVVSRWLREAGIDRRPQGRQRAEAPDPDVLRRSYVDDGLSVNELAARFGASHGTIRSWLQAAGIELRAPGRQRIPAPDPVDLRHLRQQGKSAPDIAAKYNVSKETARRWLKAAGLL